jgi:hypothetical protein
MEASPIRSSLLACLGAHRSRRTPLQRSGVLFGVRPAAPRQDGPIVVGLDGAPQSEAVLAFAVEAAVARCVALRAVRARLDPARCLTW